MGMPDLYWACPFLTFKMVQRKKRVLVFRGYHFLGKGLWALQMQNKSSLVKQEFQLQNPVWNVR